MTAIRQFGLHLLRIYWEHRTYKTAVALSIVTSAIALTQFILLGKFIEKGNTFVGIESYGGNIISFLLSGSMFTGFVAVSLGAFSTYLQEEQRTGTLESVLAMPTELTRIMVYSGGVGLIGTTVGSALMLGVFGLMFHIPFSINLVGVVAVLSLLVAALGSFGLAGCGVLLVTKRGDPIRWLVTMVTTLLSGVMYPITILPNWLQAISRALPTTQALDGLRRALLQDAGLEQVLPTLADLALWSVATLPMGLVVLKIGLARARAGGTLGEY